MKTAISIPDATFERAERRAHELGVSRSELYSTAVEGLLRADEQKRITGQIDEALSFAGGDDDLGFLSRAATKLVDPRESP